MNQIIIGVTGHRMLTAEQGEKIRPAIRKAIENILFTVREHEPRSRFVALSPLAEGADTIFAQEAGNLELPLRVILPFEREEYMKGFSSDAKRSEFDAIYDSTENASRSILNSISGKEANQLYLDLGHKVVNESNYLVVVWDEQRGHGMGGTADIVAYAIEKNKHLLLINPEAELPYINYLHRDSHYKRNTEEEMIFPADTNHLLEFLSEKQNEFDSNGMLYNRKYKRLWTAGFIIGLIEVFAFSLSIPLHDLHTIHFILATTEFLSIIVIIFLVIFGNAKELHSKYVHYRIVSERLRIKKFFAELGFRISHTVVSPIYISFKEKPEFNILDNTIRLINLSAFSYLSFEEKKRRLGTELITDQYEYHERKEKKFEHKNKLYQNVRKCLLLLFLCAVTLHFTEVTFAFLIEHDVITWEPHLFHSGFFKGSLIFFSIFIPATVAACEALKYLYEWEKIITLSAAMAGYFREKARKLEHTRTEEDLEVFINAINRDMLIENLDWEKYMHDKNEVPT